MELRRVQVTRGGTFFISLPKQWAERNGLKRSSAVAMSVAADGRLVIDPKYDVERVPSMVAIKPSQHLEREIIGKYLLGYDIIRIEAKDQMTLKEREKVKQTSSRLIGLEIIEEDYAKILLQCLLEPSALPPEKILRREHSISLSMHRDAVTALVEGDLQLARSVIDRDNEVDRLYFLLVRILRTIVQNPGLSEKLSIYPIECLDYRLVASLVESIGDRSAEIAEQVIHMKGSRLDQEISKRLTKLHEAVYESQRESIASFLSKSIQMAESVRARRETFEKLYQEVEAISDAQPAEVSSHLLSVISLMSRIYDNSVDISDLTMPKMR
ncbi:MAG: PhoU domain-containing protein [Candidatus Bathyarchaeia archaeon]